MKLKEKKNIHKFKENKGYAIMFTVILVSIISLISLGLSNTTYKQLLLSSGAKDSGQAFYQADMSMECALYIDNQTTTLPDGDTTFSCGMDKNTNQYQMNITSSVSNSITTYNLLPTSSLNVSQDPCFRISILKDNSNPLLTTTTIYANGYNICNINNPRAVERTIQANY